MRERPVTERVGRWLSSLSAKYIAVCALLVAVPVICTSVYLLHSSYRDNKRALVRLQQEKARSVAVTIEPYTLIATYEAPTQTYAWVFKQGENVIANGTGTAPCASAVRQPDFFQILGINP